MLLAQARGVTPCTDFSVSAASQHVNFPLLRRQHLHELLVLVLGLRATTWTFTSASTVKI